MTHLDLCSGIGGFALAARWMGWKTLGFAEIDPFASAVLAKHWPGVPNYGDIANITADMRSDIITAGFPCQPYSCAGKRLGAEDDRAIWPLVVEIVKRVNPVWCVFENVAGFIGMALDDVLSDLDEEGYEVGTVVLPACAVNAPHRRDRVWIVAHTKSKRMERPKQSEIQGRMDTIGKGEVVADAESIGSGSFREEIDESWRTNRIGGGLPSISDADRQPMERLAEPRRQHDTGIAQSRLGRVADGLPDWMDRHFDDEPDVARIAAGIENRRNRLKALGNAIVPQVAYRIFSAIEVCRV